MFIEGILSDDNSIFKFLRGLDLDLFLSKPQFNHLTAFLNHMTRESYDGKISNVKHRHRTSLGRFLNKSQWECDAISTHLQSYITSYIYNRSQSTGQPVYVSIDDTTCVKTKPSSQASHPIQGCGGHFSHVAKRQVYGHQFVAVVLSCDGITLPYQLIPYEKDKASKIELVQQILKTLPTPPLKGYFLADSWYTCTSLLTLAHDKGFAYLGAVKTNRVIFPKGHRPKGIQLKVFAHQLNLKDLDLVTVGSTQYYTYTYEGRIKGGELVKIILSWPKKTVFNEKTLRCFISQDNQLSAKQILKHYTKRWPIETFFRDTKQSLGLANYQIRTLKGIRRLMLLIQLVYLYIHQKKTNHQSFGETLRMHQIECYRDVIKFVHDQTRHGMNLSSIFETLKVA